MRANAKARKRLLASLLALVLVTGMLPAGAFAENHPATTGADVAVENVAGDGGSAGEEAGDPGDPGELPGSAEDKKQGDGGGEPSPDGNPAPSPSGNGQETPPAAPQENTSSTAPHEHEFGAEWKSDGANHWHECTAGDGQKADEAAHAFSDWTTVKQATETETGSKERSCTTCGYAETEIIPTTETTRQRTLLGAQGGVDINEANFPDANFRQYVRDNFDADRNSVLSAAEIAAVTRIACQQSNIASLKGVEHFTALERLYCWRNRLTSLDLSQNTALKEIECSENQIAELNLSKNPELISVRCDSNALQVLDVSQNVKLRELFFQGNQITALDLRAVPRLRDLVQNVAKDTSNASYDRYYDSQTRDELRMDKNVSLTYVSIAHTVAFAADPAGDGTVTGGGTVAEGQETTVTATASEGYIFDGWYVGATKVSDEASYTFTVTSDVSLTAKFVEIVKYDLWVGGTQVDETNKDNIPGVTGENAKASFDPATNTLTLENVDGVTGSTMGALITAEGIDLTIKGDAVLANASVDMGIQVAPGSLTLDGDFTISAESYGIYVQKDVTVAKGSLFAEGWAYGIYSARGAISVNGSKLEALGSIGALGTDPVLSGYDPDPGVLVNTEAVANGAVAWNGTDPLGGFDSPYKYVKVSPAPKLYSVTVAANPAEGGTVTGGGQVTAGESATVTATANAGYEFDGWYDGTTKVSEAASYTFTVTGDIALTARFVKMWTVTVDMNGGTIGGAESSAMVFRDGHVGRIPTAEDMAGWIADGTWITGPAGSEYVGAEITDASSTKAYRPGDAYTVASDAAIKVLWKPAAVPPGPPAPPAIYTISYDLNGGTLDGKTGVVTVEAESGTVITLPAPTREGYAFDYWKGSRYSAGDSYTVEGDHTLTAQWRKDAPAAPAGANDTGKASPGTSASDAGKSSPGKSSPGKALPKTGDGSIPALWLGMAAAALALALLAVRRKRPQD